MFPEYLGNKMSIKVQMHRGISRALKYLKNKITANVVREIIEICNKISL